MMIGIRFICMKPTKQVLQLIYSLIIHPVSWWVYDYMLLTDGNGLDEGMYDHEGMLIQIAKMNDDEHAQEFTIWAATEKTVFQTPRPKDVPLFLKSKYDLAFCCVDDREYEIYCKDERLLHTIYATLSSGKLCPSGNIMELTIDNILRVRF